MKMKDIKICPSVVCADLSQLGNQVRLLDEAGVDMFHWDIMDGVFVHNFCLTPDMITACRPFTQKPFDVHMCIADPAGFVPEVVQTGADIISLQFEATPHVFRAVQAIHKAGRQAGVVLSPKTPLSEIEYLLGELQMVTIMTVDVGFAGQTFIYPMLDKIRQLREMIDARQLDVDIQVDGQINDKTFKDVLEAGANVLVVGTSGLFNVDKDLKVAVKTVREKLNDIAKGL
jgi:ribulose-phosphate 3-epimerase